MIIMFILMFLPVIELPLFWLLPVGQALLIYLLSLPATFWMYWLMRRNRKHPVVTGRESLPGRQVEILAAARKGSLQTYTVRVEGELWGARSAEDLKPGDKATITGFRGRRLVVKKNTVPQERVTEGKRI